MKTLICLVMATTRPMIDATIRAIPTPVCACSLTRGATFFFSIKLYSPGRREIQVYSPGKSPPTPDALYLDFWGVFLCVRKLRELNGCGITVSARLRTLNMLPVYFTPASAGAVVIFLCQPSFETVLEERNQRVFLTGCNFFSSWKASSHGYFRLQYRYNFHVLRGWHNQSIFRLLNFINFSIQAQVFLTFFRLQTPEIHEIDKF